MSFIADASVSLCWFLPEQFTQASAVTLVQAEREGITVPPHWHLEVLNKLGLNHRTARLAETDLQDALGLLQRLPIQVEQIDPDPDHLLALMHRHRLTAYDAAYLQLAINTGLPLATYDKALLTAAPLAGVTLLH